MRFRHKRQIPIGVKGELSYIQEELTELQDADEQGNSLWSVIESSDVLIAIGKYSRRHHWTPLLVVILLAYCRMVYKPIRNRILNLCGVSKEKILNNTAS